MSNETDSSTRPTPPPLPSSAHQHERRSSFQNEADVISKSRAGLLWWVPLISNHVRSELLVFDQSTEALSYDRRSPRQHRSTTRYSSPSSPSLEGSRPESDSATPLDFPSRRFSSSQTPSSSSRFPSLRISPGSLLSFTLSSTPSSTVSSG